MWKVSESGDDSILRAGSIDLSEDSALIFNRHFEASHIFLVQFFLP